ncbi:hypothetical protein Palpr_2008 [Paludibacter propionicigenes WB4]|uniref:Uncharacterized protein n=1 Tax=Paludibacter propionicigenes (strain DSM 17365 / JCM 13257 / WB4) TaxID=694427 RepID=E4T601_PALPW|nr:hypothetical protein Palpr_2008 [Paludibacter propionicigenes WB4]
MLIDQIEPSEVKLYLYVFKHFYFIIPYFADYISLGSAFIDNRIILELYFLILFTHI